MRGLSSLPGCYGPLGETEHIGALGVLGDDGGARRVAMCHLGQPRVSNRLRNASRAGRVRALRSYVRLQEILRRYAAVDVLGCYVHHLPSGCGSRPCLTFVSCVGSRVYVQTRAREVRRDER